MPGRGAMPAGANVLRLRMRGCQPRGSCEKTTAATITLSHSKNWNRKIDGWKAVLVVGSERTFGSWRPCITDAVEAMLERFASKIPESELQQVRAGAAKMQARRERALPSGTMEMMESDFLTARKSSDSGGFQPSDPKAPEGSRDCPKSSQPKNVQYVHQIYGLFGDSKPMSELFKSSHHAWKACAVTMGAQYHLWNSDEIETLVRTRYPQFWDLYTSVRYPIMRVDIGRIAILHAYGGLYADLDTLPTRHWYSQAQLAVAIVSAPTTWKVVRDAGDQPREDKLEMEVIVGQCGEPFFLRWLTHIAEEIAGKPYQDPKSFWWTAKMRYVYNTTGPVAMKRFLEKPENASLRSRLLHLRMNWFKDVGNLSRADRRHFDIITTESNSYFTKEHEIRVPVGTMDVAILPPPRSFRLRDKNPFRQVGPGHVAPTVGFQPREEEPSRAEESIHIAALKMFFQKFQNSVSVQVTLENMPAELRAWLVPSETANPDNNNRLPAAPSASSGRARSPLRSRSRSPQRRRI